MNNRPCALYRDYPTEAAKHALRALFSGLEQRSASGPVPLLFRADDIGVPSDNYFRLLMLFKKYRLPLCLAVVPCWITRSRWSAIAGASDGPSSQWCWHQHGWRHHSHSTSGKKAEFGPGRTAAELTCDLKRGKQKLEDILGTIFYPVFTPPWNRCSPDALRILADLGFKGVSASQGTSAQTSPITEIPINADLHTRKEGNGADCLAALSLELQKAARSPHIGIMLHHQLMNAAAFDFLEQLMVGILSRAEIHPVHFKDLLS